MSRLSNTLKSYFTKQGNRYVFSNGHSLNQLANDIWEILGFQGFDPSILSKILQGERQFNLKQLNAFCRALKIPHSKQKYLQECLYHDRLEKFGFYDNYHTSREKPYLELLEASLSQVALLDSAGFVRNTVEFSEMIIHATQEKLTNTTSDQTRKNMLNLLGDVIRYYSENLYYLNSSPLIYSDKQRSVKWLYSIGTELKSDRFIQLSKFKLAEIYYVNGKYRKAIEVFKNIDLERLPNYEKIIGLKDLIVSLAFTNMVYEYQEVKATILTEIDSQIIDYQIAVFDGLARSEGFLGNFDLAGKYLDKSWLLLKQTSDTNQSHFYQRSVQLLRSQLRLLDGCNQSSTTEFKRIKKQALQSAEKYNLQNFADQIAQIGIPKHS